MSSKQETSDSRTPHGKPSARRKSDSMSAATAVAASKNSKHQAATNSLDEPMDIILAPNWNTSGECTVLVQIDPEDSDLLELEGSQGVVGRIETDDQGVILDLKGQQYRGRIYPGPTVLIVSVMSSKADAQPQLKVDAITDEFVRLEALGESMQKFEAKTVGDMDDYYVDSDEDVNRSVKAKSIKTLSSGKDECSSAAKRKTAPASKSSGAATKKRKLTKK